MRIIEEKRIFTSKHNPLFLNFSINKKIIMQPDVIERVRGVLGFARLTNEAWLTSRIAVPPSQKGS